MKVKLKTVNRASAFENEIIYNPTQNQRDLLID